MTGADQIGTASFKSGESVGWLVIGSVSNTQRRMVLLGKLAVPLADDDFGATFSV
jgi:hypothetical protein